MVQKQYNKGGDMLTDNGAGLYGYEDYSIMKLNAGAFTSRYTSLTGDYNPLGGYRYLRIMDTDTPDFHSINTLLRLQSVKDRMYTPKPGDTLYFLKECTLPRMRVSQYWKIAKTLTKADTIVIPDAGLFAIFPDVSIFVDENTKTVLACHMLPGKEVPGVTLGQVWEHQASASVRNSGHEPAGLDTYRNAMLVFRGKCLGLKKSQLWVYDIMDNLYPRITRQDSLLELVEDSKEAFTTERIQETGDMLKSTDKETVMLALKTLASMDYVHYPNVTVRMLRDSEYSWYPYRNCSNSVAYMLDRLHYSRNSPLGKMRITPQEFPIMKELLLADMRKTIDTCVLRLREMINCSVSFSYTMDILSPEETDKQTT